MFPLVITEKIKLCKDFYTKYFGFEAVFDSDWYIHLRNPSGVELGFMMPDLKNQPHVLHSIYAGNGVVISFEVEEIEEEYKKHTNMGIDITYDLKNEEWGQKHYMVKDPSGMIIDIIQYVQSQ